MPHRTNPPTHLLTLPAPGEGRPSRPLSDRSEPRVHSADSVLPDSKAASAASGKQPKAKSEGAAVAAAAPAAAVPAAAAPAAAAAAPQGPGHIDGF